MSQDREENWFIVRRTVQTMDQETRSKISAIGAQIGGGWHEIHTHIYIDPIHQSECKEVLEAQGYKLEPLEDTKMCHPEGACKLVFENSNI